MGLGSVEARHEFSGHSCHGGNGEFGAMGVEHLHKPAHVGAFVLMRQVDCECDGGDRVLLRLIAVSDAEREAQIANADPINRDATVVALVLRVCESSHRKKGEKKIPLSPGGQQWERGYQVATGATVIKASD